MGLNPTTSNQPPGNLILWQWNAQGLHCHGDELIHYIRKATRPPSLICIQETWFNDVKHPPLNIPNYTTLAKNRIGKKGGGCAIYIKNNISYTIAHTHPDKEYQKITIYQNSFQCDIINYYNNAFSSGLDGELLNSIVKNCNKNFILCGDFNSHNPIWGSQRTNTNGRRVEKIINEYNLVILNDGSPTHFDINNGTLSCIDLTITSPSIASKSQWSVHHSTLGSDHYPIQTILQLHSTSSPDINSLPPPHPPRWSFPKANWNLYKEILSTLKLEDIINNDVQELYDSFIERIIEAADASIPKTQNKKAYPPNPWWNTSCTIAIRERNRANRKFRKSLLMNDLIEYKKKKAQAQALIRKTKQEYWEQFCSSLNRFSSMSLVWKKIKSMRQPQERINAIPLNVDGVAIKEDKEKANIFANYYEKLSHNHTSQTPTSFPKTGNNSENLDPINELITIEEMNEALNRTPRTSPGPDGIYPDLIINIPNNCKDILLYIFNAIWTSSHLPEQWKQTIVTPIRKYNKKRGELDSYRPISLTSIVCKLMERIITQRLKWFSNKYNIITPLQSGFTEKRSVLDNLSRLDTDIHKTVLEHKYLIAIFLDFEKAFDIVNRDILINKLKCYGFSGNILSWIVSFLGDRSFQVKINNSLSTCKPSNIGLPQGSVLSPFLFSFFINDITNCCKNSKVAIFADDVAIWYSSFQLKQAEKKIQEDLNSISLWTKQAAVKISASKSKAIVFTRNTTKPPIKLHIAEEPIETIPKHTFLGVVFDEKHSWHPHINYVVERCKTRLNIIRCLVGTHWGADTKTLLILYRAIIRPILDYACQIFISALPTIINKLNAIQYISLRIITGALPFTSLESLLIECGEMPLDIRRKYLCHIYKLKIINAAKSHPTKEIFLDCWQYQIGKFKRPPLPVCTLDYNPIVEPDHSPEQPYWHFPLPPINLELHGKVSKKDNPLFIYQTAIEFINTNYANTLRIYTDGSKDPTTSKTAAAFYIPQFNIKQNKSLSPISICRAEQTAIILALDWLEDYRPLQAVILTDSLSTLQLLQNRSNIYKPIIYEIYKKYQNLLYLGVNITFTWIPAHCGIEGNEIADKQAKRAILKDKIEIAIKPNIEEKLRDLAITFRSEWGNKLKNSHKTTHICSIVSYTNSMQTLNLNNRREETIIHRIRTGVIRLAKFLFDIGKHPNGLCETCKVIEDLNHYIFHCSKYTQQRANLLLQISPLTLQNILNSDGGIKNLLLYVKATGQYNNL